MTRTKASTSKKSTTNAQMMTVYKNETEQPRVLARETSEKIDALCDRVELSREQIFKTLARLANGGNVESNITRAFYHCGEIKDCLAMIKNYCNQKN